jgi:hypothetical protein
MNRGGFRSPTVKPSCRLPCPGAQRRDKVLSFTESSGKVAESVVRLKNTTWFTWWISSAIWGSV